MSLAAYTPWSRVNNIDVKVVGLRAPDGSVIESIRVPWVCAMNAEAVIPTATVTVFAVLRSINPDLFEEDNDA